MRITKYCFVLSAAEKRASRYRRQSYDKLDPDKVLYNKAINEMGMVSK